MIMLLNALINVIKMALQSVSAANTQEQAAMRQMIAHVRVAANQAKPAFLMARFFSGEEADRKRR